MTSHFVAPTPKPASRMLAGTARSASAAVMMTMGSTTTASVSPPAMTRPAAGEARPATITKTARPSSP